MRVTIFESMSTNFLKKIPTPHTQTQTETHTFDTMKL